MSLHILSEPSSFFSVPMYLLCIYICVVVQIRDFVQISGSVVLDLPPDKRCHSTRAGCSSIVGPAGVWTLSILHGCVSLFLPCALKTKCHFHPPRPASSPRQSSDSHPCQAIGYSVLYANTISCDCLVGFEGETLHLSAECLRTQSFVI